MHPCLNHNVCTISEGCSGSCLSQISPKGNAKKILAAAFSMCLATTNFYYFNKKRIPCSHVKESANKNQQSGEKPLRETTEFVSVCKAEGHENISQSSAVLHKWLCSTGF